MLKNHNQNGAKRGDSKKEKLAGVFGTTGDLSARIEVDGRRRGTDAVR